MKRAPEAGSLHLHADGDGDGPPLVLLHGFTGAASSWAPLRAALRGFRTIAIELPGHGRSDAPHDPGSYALPSVADLIACVLDAHALDRVAMLGYSMGGRTALHFAVRHPARLSALVLESASAGIADEAERAARVGADGALADDIERDGIEAFVDRWERLPLWESQRALPAAVRNRLRAQRLANSARGLANSLRGAGAGAEPSLGDMLHRIDVPALLVGGALDSKYVAIAEQMGRAMPDARVEIVEGAGHAVHIERPAQLAHLVDGFLRP